MGQAWESCMSLCTRSIDQNSVTCPHLIVREAEKVSELRKKGNRFEKPIAMPATGFCRCHRAMLFNVIVTSHIQDSDSCKLVKLRISFESQGKFFCRVWLYVPVLL